MGLPEWIRHKPLGEFDLSTRSYNALKKFGINTFEELFGLRDEQMLRLPWFGRKCLDEVHEIIHQALLPSAHGAEPQQLREWSQSLHRASPTEASAGPQGNIEVTAAGWIIPVPVEGNLAASIDSLDLSVRSSKVLKTLGIKSVGQLLECPKSKLEKAKNFGRKSLAEVQGNLFDYLSGNRQSIVTTRVGTKIVVDGFLSQLPDKHREVLADRYGLWDGVAETLQDIGDKYGLTRERIRQIEAKALGRLRRGMSQPVLKASLRKKVEGAIAHGPNENCGVFTEDELLPILADDCTVDEALLALGLIQDLYSPGENFLSHLLTEAEEGIYCLHPERTNDYKAILHAIVEVLERHRQPVMEAKLFDELLAREVTRSVPHGADLARRVLKISPSLARLTGGTLVLSRWSAFRRRDLASSAEAALMVLGRPAHFTEIAHRISTLYPGLREVDQRTVHNRLVARRDKFVWVRNGTYGLKAWGLRRPPYVKDRLIELLSGTRYPLPYWHLKEKVLEVCNCREESVRMTLDLNPKVFKKFDGDQYGLREHFDG